MNFQERIERITASDPAYIRAHADDATDVLSELMVPITLCKLEGCRAKMCGSPITEAMIAIMDEHQLRAALTVAVNTISECYIIMDRTALAAMAQDGE